MTNRVRLFACSSLFCLSAPVRAQRAPAEQPHVVSPQAPLQTTLLASLDAGRLTLGAKVYAKALVEWDDPACHLRTGSIVAGHIVDLERRSKQSKGSSITIAFDHAECNGLNTPFAFTLFAVISNPEADEGTPLIGNSSNIGFSGAGGIDTVMFDRPRIKHAPKVIESGQVFGYKKIKLRVGAGPDGASILSSDKGNVWLEGATQLVLVPRAAAVPDPSDAAAEAAKPPNPASSIPPPSASAPPPPAPVPVVALVPPPEID